MFLFQQTRIKEEQNFSKQLKTLVESEVGYNPKLVNGVSPIMSLGGNSYAFTITFNTSADNKWGNKFTENLGKAIEKLYQTKLGRSSTIAIEIEGAPKEGVNATWNVRPSTQKKEKEKKGASAGQPGDQFWQDDPKGAQKATLAAYPTLDIDLEYKKMEKAYGRYMDDVSSRIKYGFSQELFQAYRDAIIFTALPEGVDLYGKNNVNCNLLFESVMNDKLILMTNLDYPSDEMKKKFDNFVEFLKYYHKRMEK
jgi:hypothetical protein